MPGVTLDILGNSQQAQQAIAGVLGGLNKLGGAGNLLASLGAKLTAAISVGAMVEFTRRAIDAADAIGKLAQKTGVAVQQLSGLGAVAAADDLSLGQLQLAMKGLSEWMVKTGQGGRDTNEVLLEQADIFAAMSDGAEKVSLAIERFGRSGQDLIPFLNKGSDAIREQMEAAQRLGAVVGPGFAAAANEFNDGLHRIGLAFTGAANNLARDLLPALNALLKYLTPLTDGLAEGAVEILEFLGRALRPFIIGLAEMVVLLVASIRSISSFTGALAGGASVFEAARAADEAFNDEMERGEELIQGLIDSLDELDAKRKSGGAPEPGTRLETARAFLAQAQLRAATVANERGLSAVQTNRELRDIYGEQLKQLNAIEEELQKTVRADLVATEAGVFKTKEQLLVEQDLLNVQKQRAEIAQKLHDIEADTSFVARMRSNLTQLSDEWGALGRNIADALTNSIQRGVEGVTDAIMGAIEGTKTWGQVFLQVGRSIIASLIQVVVQWIAQMTIVRALQRIFHTEQTVQAGQRAVAEAPGAALASTASYGTAAIIGAVALAAVLALALAAAFGAFAEGGIVRGGEQLIRVNERGTEAVLNAQALANVGEGFVLALNAGLPVQQAAAVAPAAPAVKNQNTVNVVVFDDKARMNEYLQSAEGSAVVLDLMQKQMHNLTGKA